jgi:hypothetical protein
MGKIWGDQDIKNKLFLWKSDFDLGKKADNASHSYIVRTIEGVSFFWWRKGEAPPSHKMAGGSHYRPYFVRERYWPHCLPPLCPLHGQPGTQPPPYGWHHPHGQHGPKPPPTAHHKHGHGQPGTQPPPHGGHHHGHHPQRQHGTPLSSAGPHYGPHMHGHAGTQPTHGGPPHGPELKSYKLKFEVIDSSGIELTKEIPGVVDGVEIGNEIILKNKILRLKEALIVLKNKIHQLSKKLKHLGKALKP